MEKLIDALTNLIKRGLPPNAPRANPGDQANGPATPRAVTVDLQAAPACVQRLAEAMSTSYYLVQLGEFSLYETGRPTDVTSLESTLTQACERGEIDPTWVKEHGGPGDTSFDPAQTLQLGADGGGMSYVGVTWSGGKLGLVVVEFEDPVQENLLTHIVTPEEFFAFLDERRAADAQDDVDVLKAAVVAEM